MKPNVGEPSAPRASLSVSVEIVSSRDDFLCERKGNPVGTRSTASPFSEPIRDAVERVPASVGLRLWSAALDTTLRFEPRRGCTFFVALLLFANVSLVTAVDAELRAGTCQVDITPTQPVRLGGYESRKELSQGVHDPLGARVLAFDQAGRRLVLVSIDTLGFYNDTAEPLRKAILENSALKPAELLMCAIHTHSAPILTLDPDKGPAPNLEYTKSLQTKLAEAVHTALERLALVEIGVGSGSSPVGVNRREVTRDETGNLKIILGRNPSVLMDREVQVLKLSTPCKENLAGVLFAYATHSTSLGPKNYLVSGDIHGIGEQFLENYFKSGVVAAGFAGASGNIDPWVRVLPDFRTNNGWIPEPVLMGTMLGEEVARVLEGIHQTLTNTAIATASRTLALPAAQRGETGSSSTNTAPFNVTVARLGEIAFVGWGGEVFNEIGRAVKEGSPFGHTFILTHCNGAAGYLPTRPSYSEGGYEVQSSHFGPGAAEMLAEETLQVLRQIHDDQREAAGPAK